VNAEAKSVASDATVFTEMPRPVAVSTTPVVLEIVLRGGHLVRVPAGTDSDTLQQVLRVLQATC